MLFMYFFRQSWGFLSQAVDSALTNSLFPCFAAYANAAAIQKATGMFAQTFLWLLAIPG